MATKSDIEAAVQAAVDIVWRHYPDGHQGKATQRKAIRHVAAVARRDALRDVQCCQEYHDFAECPIAVTLAEAEEAVRHGNQ